MEAETVEVGRAKVVQLETLTRLRHDVWFDSETDRLCLELGPELGVHQWIFHTNSVDVEIIDVPVERLNWFRQSICNHPMPRRAVGYKFSESEDCVRRLCVLLRHAAFEMTAVIPRRRS